MPLLRFDLVEGRSESEIRKILDVTHEVLLETLKVPKRDRYQVVHEHKRSRVIVEDTGLGFIRSDNVLLLQITSRPRSRARIAAVQTKVERNGSANLIEGQRGRRDDNDEVEMIAVAWAGYSKNVIEQASNEAQYEQGPKRGMPRPPRQIHQGNSGARIGPRAAVFMAGC